MYFVVRWKKCISRISALKHVHTRTYRTHYAPFPGFTLPASVVSCSTQLARLIGSFGLLSISAPDPDSTGSAKVGLLVPDPYYFTKSSRTFQRIASSTKINFKCHKNVQVGRIRILNKLVSRILIRNSDLRIPGFGSIRNIFTDPELCFLRRLVIALFSTSLRNGSHGFCSETPPRGTGI